MVLHFRVIGHNLQAHRLGACRKHVITLTPIIRNCSHDYQIKLRLKYNTFYIIANDVRYYAGFLTALLINRQVFITVSIPVDPRCYF